MTPAELDIIIGANVDEAIAAFRKLGYEIKKVEQSSEKLTQKGKRDFTAFGQVLQDLPFGFIAIQNNITRLLPSAGALGLAISAITAAITFAQTGFGNWTRGFTRSKEEVDEFAKGLNSARAGAIETGVKLQALVSIAKDNTKSFQERNYALTEANKLMGEHGEKLTLVNINTKAVTEEINNFTQALIQQAVANKFADKVADLVIKQTEAANEYGKAVDHFNEKTRAAIKTNKQFSNNLNPTGASLGNIFTLIEDGASVYEGTFVAAEKYKDVTKDLKETTDLFNQTLGKSISLFTQLGTKEKEAKTRRLGADKFQWLIPDFNFQVIPKLSEKMEDLQKQLQGRLDIKPLLLRFELPDLSKGLELQKQLDLINGIIRDGLAEMGQAIGNAFSGKGNIFGAFLNILGASLVKLGTYVLASVELLTNIRVALIQALSSTPALGIAVGVGLIALGTVLKNIPKFATGGVVTKPTLAMVGEQGPERITPLGYEGSNSNMWGGEVVFQISGQNLRGILRRADQTAFNTF